MSTTEPTQPALNVPDEIMEAVTHKPSLKERFALWREEHPFKASALESSSLGALYGVSAAIGSLATVAAVVALSNRNGEDETEEEDSEE